MDEGSLKTADPQKSRRNISKLTKKVIIDKNGHQKTVNVSTETVVKIRKKDR
jgi:hypothetical protein